MRVDMRHKITIQQFTSTQDSAGQPVEAWTTFATTWASIEPLIGKEYFASQQEQAETNIKIRFYHIPNVDPVMRVVYGTRTFEIKSVINYKEQNRETLLMCYEKVT